MVEHHLYHPGNTVLSLGGYSIHQSLKFPQFLLVIYYIVIYIYARVSPLYYNIDIIYIYILYIDLFHPKETSITSIKTSCEIHSTWPVDVGKKNLKIDGIIPSETIESTERHHIETTYQRVFFSKPGDPKKNIP